MQLINKSYFHFLQKIEFEISFESLPKDSYEMHNHFFLEKYEKKKKNVTNVFKKIFGISVC